MGHAEWEIFVVDEVRDWIEGLDAATHARVVQAIDLLAEAGPGLGRPLVDTIHEIYLKERADEEGGQP